MKKEKPMLESLLDKISKEFSGWGKTCAKNMLLLVVSMLKKETTCLYKMKGSVGELLSKQETKAGSHYKRLTRFFVDYAFSRLWLELLRYVFRSLRLKSDYLILDGTSWEKGLTRHHYLVLSVVYKGIAIPIYWEDLRKKGNSSQKERKHLLNKAKKYFNLEEKILLGDREYIGKEWIKFLIDSNIYFIIRLPSKTYKSAVDEGGGKSYQEILAKVSRSKKPGKVVGKRIILEGESLCFVVIKNPNPDSKDKLIYLLSSLDLAPSNIAARYPIRWKIESCFKHLKSNGFELEKTNLKGKARQKLLMAIVVFAYTLSIIDGLKTYKKVPNKTYENGKIYKAISVFRHGIDSLMNSCHSFVDFCQYLILHLQDDLLKYRSRKSIFV